MNVVDLITEFGAYYLRQGQNMARLINLVYWGSVTEKGLTPIMTEDTIWRASQTLFKRVLQPFQKAFTPLGELQFVPKEIKLFKQKIDFQDYPDELEATWAGFLASNSLDRKTWPFIRWLIEVHLLAQLKEDFEMNEIYEGVQRAIVAGQAGGPGTAMDGLKYKINNGILDGKTEVINTGALSTDGITLVDQIESFVDAINKKYWMIMMDLNLNMEYERIFLRGYEKKYGSYTNFKDNPKSKVKFTNINLVGLPSMTLSDKMWCTPKNNVYILNKKMENKNKVQIESVDRLVKIFTDWWNGVGFVIEEIIFTNDRDLGSPVIDSFEGAPVAAGGQTVTVTGRHFNDVTAVKLGAVDVTSFNVTYAKGWAELTFVSPAIAAGDYTINITNKFGTTGSADQITVGA